MFKSFDVIIFFACYLIAFLVETIRFRFKSGIAYKLLGFSFLAIGCVVHSVSLYQHNLLQNEHFFASASGWFYVLAFCLALVLTYLTLVYPRPQFGLFLFPLILSSIAMGLIAPNASFSESDASHWIRIIHGLSLLLTTLSAILGSIAGVMFFIQRYRLKNKIFTNKLSLPTLEWLSRAMSHASNCAVLTLGIGVISGYYLKLFVVNSESFISDSVILGATLLFLVTIALSLLKHYRHNSNVNFFDAALTFTLCLALIILLLFAAFENGGHWRTLIQPAETATTQNINIIKTVETVASRPNLHIGT